MGILIDTNILIKVEKGTIVLDAHIKNRKDKAFFISVNTASEFLHDSWIAASCINFGLHLVTDNTREFERKPGLQIEQWA